jgi:hypothetical protein
MEVHDLNSAPSVICIVRLRRKNSSWKARIEGKRRIILK